MADLEWDKGSFHVKGDPSKSVTIQDIAMRAHGAGDLPDGIEGGLEAQICYNPPNLTYPHGAYICVVDVDPGTAQVKVRRFIAVDDCGTRINPMIIEGQVHGGLTDGVGMALMEMIAFDEDGNCLGASLMDYLIPTALEVPDWETGYTVTPSPHHPIGAKGVGESATVGSPPAIVNAVVDALKPFGIRHADMPLTPSRVWDAMQGHPTTAGMSPGAVPVTATHRRPGPRADRPSRVPFVQADGRPGARCRRRPGRRRRDHPGRRHRSRVSSAGSAPRTRSGRPRSTPCATAKPLLLRVLPDGDSDVPRDRPAPRSWSTRVSPAERWRSSCSRCCRRPLVDIVGDDAGGRSASSRIAEVLGYATAAAAGGDVAGRRGGGDRGQPGPRRARGASGRPWMPGSATSRWWPAARRGAARCSTSSGSTDAERARISTPAGLDIGARTAPEVALSIMAEVDHRGPIRRKPRVPHRRQPRQRPSRSSTRCAA